MPAAYISLGRPFVPARHIVPDGGQWGSHICVVIVAAGISVLRSPWTAGVVFIRLPRLIRFVRSSCRYTGLCGSHTLPGRITCGGIDNRRTPSDPPSMHVSAAYRNCLSVCESLLPFLLRYGHAGAYGVSLFYLPICAGTWLHAIWSMDQAPGCIAMLIYAFYSLCLDPFTGPGAQPITPKSGGNNVACSGLFCNDLLAYRPHVLAFSAARGFNAQCSKSRKSRDLCLTLAPD